MEDSKGKETPKIEAKSFKRKFLQWTQRWTLTEDSCHTDRYTPDAVDLARLLQATGYRLRFTDRCQPTEMAPIPDVPKGQPSCKVIITCPQSGLRMHLDAPTSSCKCPPTEEDKGHSWEVMGQGPTGQMVSMGNSLIPSMERDLSLAIMEALNAILRISEGDFLRATSSSSILSMDSSCIETSESVDAGMKTPVKVNITYTVPGAPDMPTMSSKRNIIITPGRYRSLDTLTTLKTSSQDLPDPGQLTPKSSTQEEANSSTLCQQSSEKKFISRSSPEMYSEGVQMSESLASKDKQSEENRTSNEAIVRSDTFVRDSADVSASTDTPKQGPPPVPTLSPNFLWEHSQRVQDTIDEIIHVETEMSNEHVVKILLDNMRIIHRLSAVGTKIPDVPPRAATTVRPGVRPNIRRSATSSVPPVTPTSSRANNSLSSTKSLSAKVKSKSISTTSLQNAVFNKLSVTPVERSKSGLEAKDARTIKSKNKSFTSSSVKSPAMNISEEAGSPTYVFRPNQNPKYAHVRSSIPKPSPTRKKNQSFNV